MKGNHCLPGLLSSIVEAALLFEAVTCGFEIVVTTKVSKIYHPMNVFFPLISLLNDYKKIR